MQVIVIAITITETYYIKEMLIYGNKDIVKELITRWEWRDHRSRERVSSHTVRSNNQNNYNIADSIYKHYYFNSNYRKEMAQWKWWYHIYKIFVTAAIAHCIIVSSQVMANGWLLFLTLNGRYHQTELQVQQVITFNIM